MFEPILELLEKITKLDGVVAAIITGIFTYLITRYTCHKNLPVDKLEITYNRVYYPIYCLIRSGDSTERVIEKCKIYFNKYAKYVDKSTLRAFDYLKDSTGSKKEKAYSNFKSNIYTFDTKLRRRLGYMESNVFTMYTYSSESDRRMLRLVMEIMGIYLPVFAMTYIKNEDGIYALAGTSAFFIIIFIGECGWVVIRFIIKGISKLWSTIKRKIQSNNE